MAKKSGGDSKKNTKISSGLRGVRKASQQIQRLTMKANRWERYQGEITSGKRSGNAERWDTAGLLKRISQLKTLINA